MISPSRGDEKSRLSEELKDKVMKESAVEM